MADTKIEPNDRTVRIPERFVKDTKMVKQVGTDAYAVFSIIVAHAKWSGHNAGEAWPTYNTIHELTGLCDKTIAKCVKKLSGCGYIRVDKKKRIRKDGTEFGHERNCYTVSHMRIKGLQNV
jgi:hypothetical protein